MSVELLKEDELSFYEFTEIVLNHLQREFSEKEIEEKEYEKEKNIQSTQFLLSEIKIKNNKIIFDVENNDEIVLSLDPKNEEFWSIRAMVFDVNTEFGIKNDYSFGVEFFNKPKIKPTVKYINKMVKKLKKSKNPFDANCKIKITLKTHPSNFKEIIIN